MLKFRQGFTPTLPVVRGTSREDDGRAGKSHPLWGPRRCP